MKIVYPRGAGSHLALIVFDEFEYDSEMERFCRWILRKQLEMPLNYLEVKKWTIKNLLKAG